MQEDIGTKSRTFPLMCFKDGDRLRLCFQQSKDEIYDLDHYQDNTFTWWISYNDLARHGRYVTDYAASYYLLEFSGMGGDSINTLKWAWDPNLPQKAESFIANWEQMWSLYYCGKPSN